ncbi:MAG: hypothetical protein J6X44_01895 [Thermoguttaceae bacterium]|nr:hypothetical protein [Thermoguttaceae bacterium]
MKVVANAIFLIIVLLFGAVDCLAQQETPTDKGPMFVSSVDANSSTPFSAVDAARRSRPPQPAKTHEDLWYPTGFLTLSSPTPDVDNSVRDAANASSKPEKQAAPFRPIDASVETTPYTQVSTIKEPVKKKGDSVLFFALSIAIAGLGVFLYYDFLYKNKLKEDLVQNAKLCSPNAVSADFDAVLARAPEMTDPREPSFVDPTFDPDSLYYDDHKKDHVGFGGSESFEASGVRVAPGADLSEQNFDYSPKGLGILSSPTDEVVEDFVVGTSASS